MNKALKFIQKLLMVTATLTLLSVGSHAYADSDRARLAAQRILHTPEYRSELYEANSAELSKNKRWLIREHGLRTASFNPQVWALRRIDRTDSRRLIPIRPFYLRASNDDDFRLEEISLRVRFDPANTDQMSSAPSLYTPVLDIEFAGSFMMGLPGERPPEDSGYLVRLSPSPLLESGVIYRSHVSSKTLSVIDEKAIAAGVTLDVVLKVNSQGVVVLLNGSDAARYEAAELPSGLVSLTSGWHPLQIETLSVRGYFDRDSGRKPFEASGLVVLEEME